MIEEQPWEVEFTDQFEGWWNRLSEQQQDALAERVALLAAIGPSLGRPAVDQNQVIETPKHERAPYCFRRAATGTFCLRSTATRNFAHWRKQVGIMAEMVFGCSSPSRRSV